LTTFVQHTFVSLSFAYKISTDRYRYLDITN